MGAAARVRPVLAGASRPKLARHAQLRHDATRERWVLLVPERVMVPDEIAVEVLQLADGVRSIDDIAAVLAAKYAAPVEVIAGDVTALLQDLADRGYLLEAQP